jgi:formate hydrogenlyase subunit 6/NADH:ubiquinone oxidoreductase subunit I
MLHLKFIPYAPDGFYIPSEAMEAILKQNRVTPDCFSCGSCVNACPTKSIEFNKGKRTPIPKGEFKDNTNKGHKFL